MSFIPRPLLLLLIGIIVVLAQERRPRPSHVNQPWNQDPLNRRRRDRSRCLQIGNVTELIPNAFPQMIQIALASFLGQIPEICADFEFEMCSDSPTVHVNISVNGVSIIDQNINDETQICDSNYGTRQKPCSNCVNIQNGTFVVKPNYARLCPVWEISCDSIETEILPSVNFPCFEFGDNCDASSIDDCLNMKGCGWCNGGGSGREFEDESSREGTGCTPMIPTKRSRRTRNREMKPFCSDCPIEKFIFAKVDDSRHRNKPASTSEDVGSHLNMIIGITVGISVVVVLVICLSCFLFMKKTRRDIGPNFIKIAEMETKTDEELQTA